jgi:hypothetical protein
MGPMARLDLDLRVCVVVLLPWLGLGCPGADDAPQDGTDSEVDSSGGATTTVGTTATTGMTTAMTTVSTTSATTGMTTVTVTTETATDSATESITTVDGTDTDTPFCEGVSVGDTAVGEACSANDECSSGVCTIYTDAPLDPEATCDDAPENCSMRVTATAVDIVTRQTPPGIEVVITSALQAATNPTGADALASATTGRDGRIDVVLPEPPVEPIGLVALLSGPTYELTATGLAAPLDGGSSYGVANDAHDLWLVSTNAVMAWSNMLSLDPSIPPDVLPLVVAGGVVGLVRGADGLPLAGATVSSTNAGSDALIRYLAGDGTFNTTGTGDFGLFVILDPALAERFEAELDGMSLGEATAGSAIGAVFTVVFTAP